MKAFLMKCWEAKSRPSVEQGRKWLSHSLTKHGRAPLNRFQRQFYQPTLDLLVGLSKDPAWREHRSAKTDAFSLETCKKLFHASVLDEEDPGRIDLKALRNKALAVAMIVNGWHPVDAYRVKDTDVTDDYTFMDRTGEHRPKIIFFGKNVHHNKQHSWKVRNVIGCGCLKDHDAGNHNCFYNVIKLYMIEKQKCDDAFRRDKIKKMNKIQRLAHVDEDGELKPMGFFRAMCRRGPERCTYNSACTCTRTWATTPFATSLSAAFPQLAALEQATHAPPREASPRRVGTPNVLHRRRQVHRAHL